MNFKQKELEGNDGDGGKHLPADLKLKQSGGKRERGDMKWRILPPVLLTKVIHRTNCNVRVRLPGRIRCHCKSALI